MDRYDVAVIGAGVIGCAVARELSRYALKTVVLEKELDVACGNSSRNTGMLHAGFTYKPGSMKAICAVEGNQEFDQVAEELGVPFRRTGKLVAGFTEEDRRNILKFKAMGEENGVQGIRIIDREEMDRIEPNAGGRFAMWVPASGILDPMQYTIALAENAAMNGVEFRFASRVESIERLPEKPGETEKSSPWTGLPLQYSLRTDSGTLQAAWVINCAGAYSPVISEMLGYPHYYQKGFKGEYYVLDKKAGVKLRVPVYPAPNSNGGFSTHATPTVDGNVLVGPDSYLTEEAEDYANRRDRMAGLFRDGKKMFQEMKPEFFIRNFAGIRWKNCREDTGEVLDFILEAAEEHPNTVNLVGIESPGVTCALPLARRAVEKLAARQERAGRPLERNHAFNPVRRPFPRFSEMTLEERRAAIQENPDYGQVVCRCENVTRAELLHAIHNPLGVHTLTGIKNRTRAMMGRCQGGYCQTRITELLEEELGVRPEELMYQKPKGYLFTGEVRPEEKPAAEARKKAAGEYEDAAPWDHAAAAQKGPRQVDAVIVGGGPAGLAAAVKLYDLGVRDILILEREHELGGILKQCIHDGFGLTRFGETLSGPEYAGRFIEEVKKRGIPCITDTTVIRITPDKQVIAAHSGGLLELQARTVLLTMGCRERTRGAISIPGTRPAGVMTAGVAQAYINLQNRMPGKEVVILGSGDIGMIMARRLTLEGAHVAGVFEVQPYPSGLARNIEQCLRDYDIPLLLHHTVTEIRGTDRLEGVVVSEVDDALQPIPGTEQYYSCDTLILSVGLIPENELTSGAGAELDPRTRGAVTDEFCETTVPGIFAAGNVLHVHDLVDFVSLEAERMAEGAVRYLKRSSAPNAHGNAESSSDQNIGESEQRLLPVHCGENVGHVVPQRISGEEDVQLSFRAAKPLSDCQVTVRQGDRILCSRKLRKALPAEMLELLLPAGKILLGEALEVSIS